MKKLISLSIIILLLILFVGFNLYTKSSYKVLKVYSPSSVAVDLNNNGKIDGNETLTIKDVECFSSKVSDTQKELANAIGIDEETALAMGFFAETYAKNLLGEHKHVQVKTFENGEVEIHFDGKDYSKLINISAYALKNGKPVNEQAFKKQVEIVKKAQLKIYNNKSDKYHRLNCKYGQMAHDAVILPKSQIPKTTKACKFCEDVVKKAKTPKKEDKNAQEKAIIKKITSQSFKTSQGNIKLFLTDLTTNLTPHKRCTTDFCTTLVKQINNTNSSIDMALYGYTDVLDVTNALKHAIQRGVNVRMVYDVNAQGSNFYPDTFRLAKLIPDSKGDSGDSQYQSSIMHNKFFIFDKKTVLTGSANISFTDLSGFNSNAIVLINSPEIAQIYEQEFEQMYNNHFHGKKAKIEQKENILLGESIVSVYFSPTDKVITDKIIPLINNAHKYIYVPAFVITHKRFTQALINAKIRGVDVRIILDATNARNQHTTHETMRKNNILVKTENYAGKMHAKSILIDDNYLIIGSMNFSKSGESRNDENILIIENPYLTKYYKDFFNYLWEKIPDIWLTKNAASESHDSLGSCFDGIDNDFDGKIDSADSGCMPAKSNH